MLITITRKNCKDRVFTNEIGQPVTVHASYDSRRDCPLRRAIHAQHPEFPLKEVFDGYIINESGKSFDYDLNVYNRQTLKQLMDGEIKEIQLNIQI